MADTQHLDTARRLMATLDEAAAQLLTATDRLRFWRSMGRELSPRLRAAQRAVAPKAPK